MTMFLPPYAWRATRHGGQLLETRFPQTNITFIATAARSRHCSSSWTASYVAPARIPAPIKIRVQARFNSSGGPPIEPLLSTDKPFLQLERCQMFGLTRVRAREGVSIRIDSSGLMMQGGSEAGHKRTFPHV